MNLKGEFKLNIYTPLNKEIPHDTNLKIFLAGPIEGAPEWQVELASEFKNKEVTFYNPRRSSASNVAFDYEQQVAWEAKYLDRADLVIFNIPPEIEHIEGRHYAQTTMIELSEMIAKGKPVIINMYQEYPLREYLFKKYPGNFVSDSDELITIINGCIDKYNLRARRVFFTSDTHFNQDRSWKLSFSRRCFKSLEEMNATLIRNWNNVVSDKDLVYHLGDFGDYTFRQYLKGDIILIPGNYEHKDFPDVTVLKDTLENQYGFNTVKTSDVVKLLLNFSGTKNGLPTEISVACMHEPTRKLDSVDFNLFGHIHGRQQIKHFGLDVGVDCQNFTPILASDVLKFYDAVQKGYYDENVWIQ